MVSNFEWALFPGNLTNSGPPDLISQIMNRNGVYDKAVRNSEQKTHADTSSDVNSSDRSDDEELDIPTTNNNNSKHYAESMAETNNDCGSVVHDFCVKHGLASRRPGYLFLNKYFTISETSFIDAITHSTASRSHRLRQRQYAMMGDSLIKMALIDRHFMRKTPGEISNLVSYELTNNANALRFDRLVKRSGLSEEQFLISSEIESSKGKYSQKMKETAFEALVCACFMNYEAYGTSVEDMISMVNDFINGW